MLGDGVEAGVNIKYLFTKSNLIKALKKQYEGDPVSCLFFTLLFHDLFDQVFIECTEHPTADHKADNLLATDADDRNLTFIHNWDPEDGLLDYDGLEEFIYINKLIRLGIYLKRTLKHVVGHSCGL